ncbi:GNAT family N-acetyltransferase [Clostridium sp. FP1]|uniref:GNAT family N-acetyltransferase n=1 Tax=Clostridium sp. FP1 TaxID=2724076 RepID=UPI0013E958D7|nr:GNAT family N-acetyltransferase [Clostridium sp. FP1]MBZ9635185.1 GNAT family N-acetyltransferase [Clostridium sp. FP1]
MKIQTKRPIFRKVEEKDNENLFKIYNDEVLTKYFVSEVDKSLEKTKIRVQNIKFHWEKFGFGDFILLHKDNSKIVGYGGLHYKVDGGNVNISYIINKSFWRTGLGKETCLALIYYGFKILELNKIVAEIDPENINSIRLIEKCGFKFSRTMDWNGFERLEYTMLSCDFHNIDKELFSNVDTIDN